MEVKQKGYKVLSAYEDGLFSISMTRMPVKYFVGRWVYPRTARRGEDYGDGPLTVFDTLDHARFFASCMNTPRLAIYECEYEEQDSPPPQKLVLLARTAGWIIVPGDEQGILWVNNGINTFFCPPQFLPVGTIFCKAVRLTREVQR